MEDSEKKDTVKEQENNTENAIAKEQQNNTEKTVLDEQNNNKEEVIAKEQDDNVKKDMTKKDGNKKKIIFWICFVIISAACIVGELFFLNNLNKKEPKKDPIVSQKDKYTSPYKMSGNSLENFDLQFLKLENEEENKVYSPLSIKYALQMLNDGASGDSREQISAIIGNYVPKKYVNSNNMSLANVMFIRNDFKNAVQTGYVNKLKGTYDADVVYDSFENAKTINDWVKDKTLNLIDNVVEDDDLDGIDFILTNALSIDMEWVQRIQPHGSKGDYPWEFSFNHEKYKNRVEINDGSPVQKVKFNNKYDAGVLDVSATINNYDIVKELGRDNIYRIIETEYTNWLNEDPGNYEYAKELNRLDVSKYVNQFIDELDTNYGKYSSSTDFLVYTDDSVKAFAKDLKTYDGTTLQYVGIMPTNVSLKEYINNVDAKSLNNVISGLKTIKPESFDQGKVIEINASIPVFKFEYNLNLKEDLKKLGVEDIFDETKSNLSVMTSSPNEFISVVRHKANIEFSNEGIKASAATVLGGAGDVTRPFYDHLFEVPTEKIDLTFDKPYMFIIRDKDSGEVWFTGTVYEPSEFVDMNQRY